MKTIDVTDRLTINAKGQANPWVWWRDYNGEDQTDTRTVKLGIIWLELFHSMPEDLDQRIGQSAAHFMQTLEGFRDLPQMPIFIKGKKTQWNQPCMMGLNQLLGLHLLPKGEDGEVILLKAQLDGGVLLGVWAESEGAARKWLNERRNAKTET